MKQNLTLRYKKINGELIPYNHAEVWKYNQFVKQLEENTFIDFYLSVHTDSREKTNAQLAKVHVMIKELAKSTGYTNKEMKELIKEKASLSVFEGDAVIGVKSFRDCSITELNEAIEECIRIGDDVGCYFD